MERIYTVEYSSQDEILGKVKLVRSMKQPELATLLMNKSIVLLSVDKQKRQYKPARRKD